MPEPLTREQLDRMQCAIPGCTHKNHPLLYLHGRCHPAAKNEVGYSKETGTIIVTCGECKSEVATIRVASGLIQVYDVAGVRTGRITR